MTERATTRAGRRSATAYLTYEIAAEVVGAKLCNRECILRSLHQHTQGYVEEGTVHWKPRVVHRRGLWNFLRLVVLSSRETNPAFTYGPEAPLAQKIWYEDVGAYQLGLDLGVRFPREFADTDRAHVRELLPKVAPWLINKDTREQIKRWARETPE